MKRFLAPIILFLVIISASLHAGELQVNVPSRPVGLQAATITDSAGSNIIENGGLKISGINAEVNLDTASLQVMWDGNEWMIRPDGSGPVHLASSDLDLATDGTLADVLAKLDTILTEILGGVKRDWSLSEITDSVTIYAGENIPVDVANFDTDVYIKNDVLTFDTSGIATEVTLASRLEREVYQGEQFHVDVDNQDTATFITNLSEIDSTSDTNVFVTNLNEISNDTDVRVTNPDLMADGDTVGNSDNALHVYELFPQRSIFDELTGEAATVADSSLFVSLLDAAGNRVEITAAGEVKTTASLTGDVILDTASMRVYDEVSGNFLKVNPDRSINTSLTDTAVQVTSLPVVDATLTDTAVTVENLSELDVTGDTDVFVTNGTFDVNVLNQPASDTNVYVTNDSLLVNQSDTGRSITSSVPLDRNWALNLAEDTVNILGTVEVTNQPASDTDVKIVNSGLGESIPVEVLNQVASDTKMTIVGPSGDTVDVTDNALQIFEVAPQRSLFDETTGETAGIINNSLRVFATNQDTTTVLPVLDESGGTGITMVAGDTYEIDFTAPVDNVIFQISSDSGEITVIEGQTAADEWDFSVFPGRNLILNRTKPQYINLYCVEDATIKWRYER